MDLRLDGKRALVTGSTAGIGYAIAEGLAQEGAEVIVNGRSAERVAEATDALNNATGTRAIGIAADLGSADGVMRLVNEAGRVDILVNNVGIFAPVPFTDISDDAWQEIFDINVMSGVRLSRALVPGMVERGWGRIIFISSESGVQTPAEMVHYGVTKTAQLALSRGIAESVAGTGVTANAVLPGPTRSEGVEEFVGKLADDQGADLESFKRDFVKTMRPSSLIGRFAETKEVANLVVFLCGEGSSAITGASLRVRRRRGAEYCMTDSARRGDGVDEEHKSACEEVGGPPGSESCFGSVADITTLNREVRFVPIGHPRLCLCDSRGRGEATGAIVGGAPFWGPIFGGLSQSTPHTIGIEVLGINWRAWLLPPGFIQPSGIDSIKTQFIN